MNQSRLLRPSTSDITVAIPTYNRGQVLIDTLRDLLTLEPRAEEILLLDQTPRYDTALESQLRHWDTSGQIHWLRLPEPSIPHAMNQGLLAASQDIVLFLDDDIRPEPGLLQAHLDAHRGHDATLVAGRVIQPWQEGVDFSRDVDFHFASLKPLWVDDFMGGNFSIRRGVALSLGGFDENFVKVAYRFEAEFAYRLRRAGHHIYYEPAACLHHLKATAGGTRLFGHHLTTFKPDHAVGDYYYILRTWTGWGSLGAFIGRPLRAIINRHHLRRPWWIPASLLAEIAGMIWAFRLSRLGPCCLPQSLRISTVKDSWLSI
jgi:GT2 family glycosyltransferase